MENPLSWNDIEKTIFAAMVAHNKDMADGLVGASDVRYIYDALKNKGYLNEHDVN